LFEVSDLTYCTTSRKLDIAPLVLYGAISAAAYAGMSAAFPLVPFANASRLYDLASLSDHSTSTAIAYALIVVVLFGAYARAWQWLRRVETERTSSRRVLCTVIGFAVLSCLLLLWMYPINATDLFSYFFRGRTFVFYGANPFVDTPSRYRFDPYVFMVGEWYTIGSPYGPAWELLAGTVLALTRGRLIPGLLALKAVETLAYGACTLLVYAILARISPEYRASGTLLLAWNPLILLEWIGGGHNDAAMILFILLGIWLWSRRQYIWVLPAFVTAVLIKSIAVLVIPLFLLDMWREQRGASARLQWMGQTVLVSVVIAVMLCSPFEVPWRNTGTLWSEAANRHGYSLASIVLLSERAWNTALPFSIVSTIARGLAFACIAALYLRQGIKLWRRQQDPISAGMEAFWAYVLLAPTFRMWYPAWAMSLAALRPNGTRLLRAAVLCLAAELAVLVYGYLSEWSLLARHIPGTALTVFLPLLAPSLIRWFGHSRPPLPGMPNGHSPAASRQTR
jgi:hypothetical protein